MGEIFECEYRVHCAGLNLWNTFDWRPLHGLRY